MEHEKQQAQGKQLPAVPLTLDGSYILHQMFRVRWSAWRALGASDQKQILDRSTACSWACEKKPSRTQRALFSSGPQG